MRPPLLACLLALSGLACSRADGGAVVFRWRVVDGVEGTIRDRCAFRVQSPGQLCPELDIRVEQVRLTIADPAGNPVRCSAASCEPDCAVSGLEWTTQFEVPPGDHFFKLEALTCGRVIGITPPAVQRRVTRGAITNLNAIEILIPPATPSWMATCAGDGGGGGGGDGDATARDGASCDPGGA